VHEMCWAKSTSHHPIPSKFLPNFAVVVVKIENVNIIDSLRSSNKLIKEYLAIQTSPCNNFPHHQNSPLYNLSLSLSSLTRHRFNRLFNSRIVSLNFSLSFAKSETAVFKFEILFSLGNLFKGEISSSIPFSDEDAVVASTCSRHMAINPSYRYSCNIQI